MFANEKPTDTTESILEKLELAQAENIVAHIGGSNYLIPVPTLKLMAWSAIPDFIKDEKSDAAKKMSTLRLGLKALLRPALPEILRKTWGNEVAIMPGLNILSWLPRYFVNYFIGFLASKEWQVYVKKIEYDSDVDFYQVIGIAPYSNDPGSAKELTAASTDHQSIPRGAQPDSPGTEDRDKFGGPVGRGGGAPLG